MFSGIIRNFRLNNGLSQAAFVELIQKSSRNFMNLDVVTLSRWERGVTKPHLSRKNELLSLLGIKFLDFWGKDDYRKNIGSLINKIHVDGYFVERKCSELEVVKINAMNSFVLPEFLPFLELIIKYEKNIIFAHFLNEGLEIKTIFEKVINQYFGELIIVISNGRLLAHILSVDSSITNDLKQKYTHLDCFKNEFILSMNLTHEETLVPTLGKKLYSYLYSSNPEKVFCIYTTSKRVFDILTGLGFEYKTVSAELTNEKILIMNQVLLRNQRNLIDIILEYKAIYNE